jgi:hypothetical protein
MSKKPKSPKKLIAQKPKGIKLSNKAIFLLLLLTNFLLIMFLYDPKLFTGGDNANYIILAKSLLQGFGYRDLFDPRLPFHTQYPPGFPLILIPGLIIFDNNFALLKFFIIALALGGFTLFYLILKRREGNQKWLYPLLILAVSPLLLEYAHWILSEIPYLFFSLLAIYLFERFSDLKRNNIVFFLLTAISVTFVYFIRSIGISFVLTCLVYLIYKRQWKELMVLAIIIGIFVIPWQIHNSKVAGQTSGYFQQFLQKNPYEPELGTITFSEYLSRILANFNLYTFFVIPQILFPSITSSFLLNSLGFISLVIILIGLISIIKTKALGIWEIYLFFFMAITLSWPLVWSGDRFLLPIVPFLIYYFFTGLGNLGRWLKFKSLPIIAVFLMVILALTDSAKKIPYNLSNLFAYLKGDKYAGYSIDWQRYFETLNWLKENTEKDAIVVSRKPQFTYLLSARKSFLYQFSSDPEKIINDFYEKKANYLLFDSFYWTQTTRKYVGPVLQVYPDKFELIYKSPPPEMYVFKLK